MLLEFRGKQIKIDDSWLKNTMKTLELSKMEAITMYLEDEGYMDNEEQNELDAKAKSSKVTQKIHGAEKKKKPQKKSQKERVVKSNPTKEKVIAEIAKLLPSFATEIKVENPAKIITFVMNDECYKIDLVFQRNETKKRKEKINEDSSHGKKDNVNSIC